ncbi:MAG: EAL domain-containing protein [Wenzhouxiangella sp.]|nr:EAL domain-containing protein [Wenzhouxiangella sp.]
MTPDSARPLPLTVSIADCSFALQRIGKLGRHQALEFGASWPWFELLIRPMPLCFKGSPADFIDRLYAERVPEESDSEVLVRAINWLAGRREPTRLSINVHPQSLTRARLVGQVLRAQQKAEHSGHSLCLELVEFGECPEPAVLARNAQRLRDAGVLIALDDFGSRLNRFDLCAEGIVDLIKVDASVVRDMHLNPYREAIVESISTLAKGIQASVIAEGVETIEEQQSLSRLGIEYAQGYHFHRPEIAEI